MKVGLILTGSWSVFLFLAGAWIVGQTSRSTVESIYPWNSVFLGLALLCAGLSVTGLAFKHLRAVMFWIGTPLHGVLIVPSLLASNLWLGGDHVTGLLWVIAAVLGSAAASLLAMILMVAVGISSLRRRASGVTG